MTPYLKVYKIRKANLSSPIEGLCSRTWPASLALSQVQRGHSIIFAFKLQSMTVSFSAHTSTEPRFPFGSFRSKSRKSLPDTNLQNFSIMKRALAMGRQRLRAKNEPAQACSADGVPPTPLPMHSFFWEFSFSDWQHRLQVWQM